MYIYMYNKRKMCKNIFIFSVAPEYPYNSTIFSIYYEFPYSPLVCVQKLLICISRFA